MTVTISRANKKIVTIIEEYEAHLNPPYFDVFRFKNIFHDLDRYGEPGAYEGLIDFNGEEFGVQSKGHGGASTYCGPAYKKAKAYVKCLKIPYLLEYGLKTYQDLDGVFASIVDAIDERKILIGKCKKYTCYVKPIQRDTEKYHVVKMKYSQEERDLVNTVHGDVLFLNDLPTIKAEIAKKTLKKVIKIMKKHTFNFSISARKD